VKELVKLRFEHLNGTFRANSSYQDVYVTQLFSDMLQMMQSSIDLVEQNLTQIPDRIRYFMYFGNEEVLIMLLNALGFELTEGYLPPASNLRFNLYKTLVPVEYDDDSKLPTAYEYAFDINVTLNGRKVILDKPCYPQNETSGCHFADFVEFAKAYSYYGYP
jgi:hypothetical protein